LLHNGDTFRDASSGATLEVIRTSAPGRGALEIRRLIKPGTGRTIPHLHTDYVERFLVERGEATAKLDGRELRLGPGERLEVPIGTRHVNARNASPRDLVLRHVFDPARAFTLAYVETLGHLMRGGRADAHGEVPVLAAFAIGHRTRSGSYAAGVPQALQRAALLPLGALLARVRGYELRLPA
jgi:mannose-6-phosphate isomerase-like protein (cupin superfamily)